jgi:hypothetical protein
MKVIARLIRKDFSAKRTLGDFQLLHGSALLFRCFACEDAVRGDGDPATVAQWKIKGSSAIPYGTYPLRLTYSPKYGRNAWEVCDVPGFSGIRIHAGNTEKDTEGCLLLGERINGDCSGIEGSRAAMARFEGVMAQFGNADAVIEIAKGEAA